MTEEFVAELNTLRIDTDSVLQAMRYYVAERSADVLPEEMIEEIVSASDPGRVENALSLLTRESRLLEQAALEVLAAAWTDPEHRAMASRALHDARGKLPVIEVAIIAITAMYGMYLVKTSGVRKAESTVIRKPDGSYEIREIVEYADPSNALATISQLFTPRGRSETLSPRQDADPAGELSAPPDSADPSV
ncbi:hypothetical protein [Nocardia asteroides]|uniref:hypothetical protein n=1 Tax=Nocardia asteroides TaxID=1824 RepID=UPI001E4C0CD6|nr:hypothetical protein [Nocardia asteroides]UGT55056.1 hypothetical protein LTT85_31465 [Nocardia asteroides]